MKQYLIDTEFIRASKTRVHFLQISMIELNGNEVLDFHFDVNLNSWEQKYFTRAVTGYYGKRTQEVFESVDTLFSGRYNKGLIDSVISNLGLKYNYKKYNDLKSIKPILHKSKLLAWDTSNDKELRKYVEPINFELVDVQKQWIKKFGGNQLSLSDAYKHVLYNRGLKDESDLLSYAHFASCDILLLRAVLEFIENFNESLIQIPMEKTKRNEKVVANEQIIIENINAVEEINAKLEVVTDNEEAIELSKKLVKSKRKMATANRRNDLLMNRDVYDAPWW